MSADDTREIEIPEKLLQRAVEAVSALSSTDRQILTLAAEGDQSCLEIARLTESDPDLVKSSLLASLTSLFEAVNEAATSKFDPPNEGAES